MAVSREEQTLISLIGRYTYDAPPGFYWVPHGWKLEKPEAGFEQLFLEKVKSKPLQVGTEKQQKLDFCGKIILIFMVNIQKLQWFLWIGEGTSIIPCEQFCIQASTEYRFKNLLYFFNLLCTRSYHLMIG